MSQPNTVDPIPLEVPILGLNKRDVLTRMDPLYSPWLLNWEPEPQFLKLRGGYVRHCQVYASSPYVTNLMAYGTSKLFAMMATDGISARAYDVTTSTPALSQDLVATDAFEYSGEYAGRIAIMAANAGIDAEYTGAWNVGISWTESASAFAYNVVSSFKGRVYMAYLKNLYYSALEGVTGACTVVDLSAYLPRGGSICFLGTIASPGMRADESYFVIGTTEGDVLVYAGDNPDATNWELMAQFKLPQGLSYFGTGNALQLDNDVFIMTATGIYSLRKLFQAGVETVDPDLTISGQIDSYWTDLIGQLNNNVGYTLAPKASMAYWPEENKVYILARGHIDKDDTFSATAATMFAYNRISKGWTIHKIASQNATYPVRALTYFKNGLYYATGNVVMKYDPTVFKDETYNDAGTYIAYDVELQSAYNNFGAGRKTKKVIGFEPIFETDFDGSKVGMIAAADMGRVVNGPSNVTLQDGYNNPHYSVGATGNYIQYRFDGTSDVASTDGYKLYSVGACIK